MFSREYILLCRHFANSSVLLFKDLFLLIAFNKHNFFPSADGINSFLNLIARCAFRNWSSNVIIPFHYNNLSICFDNSASFSYCASLYNFFSLWNPNCKCICTNRDLLSDIAVILTSYLRFMNSSMFATPLLFQSVYTCILCIFDI